MAEAGASDQGIVKVIEAIAEVCELKVEKRGAAGAGFGADMTAIYSNGLIKLRGRNN